MYIAEEKQSCFDVISVNLQKGDMSMFCPGMVVVPNMMFTCNGRIIGFMINLTEMGNSNDHSNDREEDNEENDNVNDDNDDNNDNNDDDDDNNDNNDDDDDECKRQHSHDSVKSFLSIQVWQPLNFSSSDSYTRTGLYEFFDNDINRDGKLANVSLPVNKRIKFQSGDIIGYYVPANSSFRILGVQTEEYTSFLINTNTSIENFTINDSVTGLKLQPMIQVILGNGISYSN